MKKRLSCLVYLIVLLTFQGCIKNQKPLSNEEIFSKVSPSTVEIYAENVNASCLGTGFYIDSNGTIVTNYHVIEGCSFATVTTNDGGSYTVLSVLGYSKDLDLAILATTRKNSPAIEFSPNSVLTGQSVYAIGSSLGLTGTFSEGIVSAEKRVIGENTYIQITTPISQGNSGGPLVNDRGQVVGITCAGFIDGQNLNLAIPIEELDQINKEKPISMEDFYRCSSEFLPKAPVLVGIRTISLGDRLTAEYVFAQCENVKQHEEAIIELMDQYAPEQGGGQLYCIEQGDFIKEIDDWCFDLDRCVGDIALIENAYGFSICYISTIE